jgi:hypothetical protein
MKRDCNKPMGLDLEEIVEELALAGVFEHFVFDDGLLAGKDHGYEAGIQGLLELRYHPGGVRTAVVRRDEIFCFGVQEPDGAFVGASVFEALTQNVLGERIEKGCKILRLNVVRSEGHALTQGALQFRKPGVGNDGPTCSHESSVLTAQRLGFLCEQAYPLGVGLQECDELVAFSLGKIPTGESLEVELYVRGGFFEGTALDFIAVAFEEFR